MRIGIDLGGTKIEAIALSDSGEELFRKRIATPKEYWPTVEAIALLIGDTEEATDQLGSIGIGIPGILSPVTNRVKNSNSTWLNDKNLQQDLEGKLQRVVRITNDANCFAVSEATDGAGAGHRVVFGAILGTGCGGGVVFNGLVHDGRNGISGEWGHNPLPWLGEDDIHNRSCFCGRPHCIESYISGTGFLSDFSSLGGTANDCQEIMALINQDDFIACFAFERFLDRLARALAQVINSLDPDIIVLGGGLSNIDKIYQELPKHLSQYVLGKECETPIVKNVFGASSGVRGASWLWPLG
ncbi:MAG: fructokinase [Glaciecola sp.]|jgi:fructokinase